MENRIFHDRLQGQLGNQARIRLPVFRRGQYLKREFVVKPVTLNQELIFDIIEFLPERPDILLLADAVTEK